MEIKVTSLLKRLQSFNQSKDILITKTSFNNQKY